jgi:tetratricopeptide (TPR) repeat protein
MREKRGFVLAVLAVLAFVSINLSCSGTTDRQWEELNAEYIKLCYAKRYDEALPLIQHALELASKVHGPDSRLVAYTKQDMGKLMFEIGRQPEAESLYLNSIAILERETDRRTNLSYAACLRNLGQLYMSQQRFDEA